MLCDDDFICLWSLQTYPTITTSDASPSSESVSLSTAKNVWSNEKSQKPDPMQLLFGSHSHGNTDSGITSPNSQHNIEEELNLMDVSNDELRLRINGMLRKSTLDDEDKQCLQHLSAIIQQMDIFSQRSGPDSLNTTSSSDEPSSLELVKSRISDYSSASSSSSSRSANDNHSNNAKSLKSIVQTTNSRIVATVSPYNSSPQHQVPTNTPTDSPRKQRQAWQSNSLSESGVFVESDFLSDTSENNAYTQTDFEEETISTASRLFNAELQKLCSDAKFTHKVPAAQLSPNLSEQKRLQYYKERLDLLESKVLIYESSGDIQAKRLADRLQREIQLEKQLRELQDRVEFLESENSTLEEEKCEFEEAENDTRLRLQRLEVELEILRQRNVELEMSREALSAKYKDCRSECLILRDDLSVSETQIRHLEEDKQKAKENLEFLHNTVWIILLYNALVVAPIRKQKSVTKLTENLTMGNTESHPCFCANNALSGKCSSGSSRGGIIDEEISKVEVQCLRDQITCLQHQLKEMDARHYEAMEVADAHWHDLEANYKEREQSLMAKEMCLKQKINRLQDVLRDDARAADEKILCMEESEKELKSCIMRLTKEYRDLNDEYKCLCCEIEQFKEKQETLEDKQKPLLDALEQEKKANKTLRDEVNFMCKLQQETEKSNLTEIECLRGKLYDLKKETLHIEVTNSELREEVETLEAQIKAMVIREKENDDKIRVLTDELRNKEELCQKYEKQFDNPCDGSSLADELGAGPSKRHRREEVHDLKTATEGLVNVLSTLHDCNLPTERYFRCVALEVQKLAEKVLSTQKGGDDKGKDKDQAKDTDKDTDKDKDKEKDDGKNVEIEAVLVVIEDVEDGEDLVKNPTTSNQPIDTVENIVTEQEPQNEPERDTGGQENSTTIVGISLVPPFSSPKNSQNEPESDREDEEKNTTIVGMALVPSFTLPEEDLPSCSQLKKKEICEVPSMLRKITLESNIEEKQSQNCFNGSNPHLDTSSSPDCAPACKITYYELRKQQKQQQQQQQQTLSCNANINYPTNMRTVMHNMQEQPQDIEMPRQKICRCGRVKKQQNVTVNAYQEVAPNIAANVIPNDALKRSKPCHCGKGASAANLHALMNELAPSKLPADTPIRKKPCNCSRKNEMLMSKSENAFPKAETHQPCHKNDNRGQLPCNSVHNMQTCNAGQSFGNKCSHPPMQSSLPTTGRSCGNMHTSCNKQPTMSCRQQTCSSKAESIYGTPESMGSYDTCPKMSCGKQKSEIQIKPLCELQGNDAIGKSFYATPSNSSPCQQANYNQMSTSKVCKRFPSNTQSTSCSPSKHSLFKPCNQPRPESSSTALHTSCGQQADQGPCGQPKPQSSNIALQKSCDRQKSHASNIPSQKSCGRVKPQASKTELQMPCGQAKSQTFSLPSQKSCGHVKTQPSNAAMQMPCGQASTAKLQMPCGQAKSQASNLALQMPCGAKSQSLNIPSQKSCHMKPQASNIGLQMPCGEKKSQIFNTPSQKSCGQAKSQASNAAPHMPCGFTKSQTLNVPSQKSCGHAKSQVCNVGAPMTCGNAQSQNLNVPSQKSCGHMKSQTCNAPSQKSCGQIKSKASNIASQSQCGKSKSQQSHMPCKRSKSEVFYSPASSDGEDNDKSCPKKKSCSKLNEAKARSLAILKLLHEVVHLINEDHPEENPCSYSMLERELSHDMPKPISSSPCKNMPVAQHEISPCSKSTISPCSEPIEAPCSQPAETPCSEPAKSPCSEPVKSPCSEPAKSPCSEPSPCSKPPPLATLPCNLIISPDMQITIAQILAGTAPPQTALSAAMKPTPCTKDLESTTDTSIGTEEKCWQSTLVKSFYHDSIDKSQMDLPCSCSYEMNEAAEYEEQPYHIDNNNALFKEQGGYEEMSYNIDTGGSVAEEENYPNMLNIYEPQAAEEDNYPNMLNIYEAQSVRDTTETSSDGVKAAFVTIIEELATPCNVSDNMPCNVGNNMDNNMGNNAPCTSDHCSQEDLRVRRDLLCSQPRHEEQCDCNDDEPKQNADDMGCNVPPPPQDSCSGNKEIIMPQQCPVECDEPVFIDEPCDDGSDDKNAGTCSDTDNEKVPICGKENEGDDCKCCHCRAMRECPNEHNMQLVRTDSCTSDKPPKNDDDMKFFINSIIMDLEAMEYARRTKNNERKLFAKKKQTGPCNSFPVTITDVSELGATSLYVKWEIEDCSNISGYEIFVDGFLTNRYFNCSHTAAVICDVDVTAPHKIILVAQPYMNEECLCPKSTESEKNMDFNANKSVVKRGLTMPTLNPSALWTPSVYFYDPPEYCKAPDISRECDFE